MQHVARLQTTFAARACRTAPLQEATPTTEWRRPHAAQKARVTTLDARPAAQHTRRALAADQKTRQACPSMLGAREANPQKRKKKRPRLNIQNEAFLISENLNSSLI